MPPERTMSEAAPLRKACHEHLSIPKLKPRRLSSEEARRDLRLPKTQSNLEPPRLRWEWEAAIRAHTPHLEEGWPLPQRQGREIVAPPGALFLEAKWIVADAGPDEDFLSKTT